MDQSTGYFSSEIKIIFLNEIYKTAIKTKSQKFSKCFIQVSSYEPLFGNIWAYIPIFQISGNYLNELSLKRKQLRKVDSKFSNNLHDLFQLSHFLIYTAI